MWYGRERKIKEEETFVAHSDSLQTFLLCQIESSYSLFALGLGRPGDVVPGQ